MYDGCVHSTSAAVRARFMAPCVVEQGRCKRRPKEGGLVSRACQILYNNFGYNYLYKVNPPKYFWPRGYSPNYRIQVSSC